MSTCLPASEGASPGASTEASPAASAGASSTASAGASAGVSVGASSTAWVGASVGASRAEVTPLPSVPSVPATGVAGKAAEADELPDGVLPAAGPDLAVLVGVVGAAAIGEAGWNVGQACLHLLHLPGPLAVMFPLVLESAASSCALQDLRDRRRGVRSRALAAGTYVGLAVSAAVNAAVGWAGHGAAGLLEVLPPLVLGALIHLHGDRSERAWRSRAKTRPAWRREQLEQARIDSVGEVLPLLTGTDPDGQATVALLRRRLASATLTPAEALLAAGWHDRHARALTGSQVRRLEIVAATVWPDGAPPAPAAPALPLAPAASATASQGAPQSASAGAPSTASAGASSTASAGASSTAPQGASAGASRSRATRSGRAPSTAPAASAAGAVGAETRPATDAELADLIAQARAVRPTAGERPVRELLRRAGLTASAEKLRAALRSGSAPAQPDPHAHSGVEADGDVDGEVDELDQELADLTDLAGQDDLGDLRDVAEVAEVAEVPADPRMHLVEVAS